MQEEKEVINEEAKAAAKAKKQRQSRMLQGREKGCEGSGKGR